MARYLEHKPALILCDACMPGISGLDFIDKVRQINEQVLIIVISSHKDFNYVKRSLNAKVFDYLLKNEITAESLTAKLREAACKYRATSDQHERFIRALLSDYFDSKSERPNAVQENPVGDVLDKRVTDIISNSYYYLLVAPQKPLSKSAQQSGSRSDSVKLLFNSLRDCSTVSAAENPVLFYSREFTVIGINRNHSGPQTIRMVAQKLINRQKQLHQPDIVVFYYPKIINLSKLRSIKDKVNAAMNFHTVFVQFRLFDLTELLAEASSRPTYEFDVGSVEGSLYDANHFNDLFESYVHHVYHCKNIEKLDFLYRILIAEFEKISEYELAFTDSHFFTSQDDYIEYLEACYAKVIRSIDRREVVEYSRPVEQAIEYIKQNFSNPDLSIEQIASQVNLSPSRISVIFKRETDTTVNEYLTTVRIRYATYLLKETNHKINEIARQVGYRSSQYFSKVFSHRTGRKPIDFK